MIPMDILCQEVQNSILTNFQNMLSKQIRKSLVETKEKKETLLIEGRLIKNRLSIIVERTKTKESFKSQSKKNQLKISAKFIQELSYLKNVGLLNEANLTDSLQSIFGNSFGNITETMFEPILNVVLQKLGFGEGLLKKFIVSSLKGANTKNSETCLSALKQGYKMLFCSATNAIILSFLPIRNIS